MEDVNGKNKVEKKKVLNELIKVFWVFIIGSIIGYIVEMIVGILQNGHFVSRQGLLIGPFIQVYGIGLVSYYLVISRIKNTPVAINHICHIQIPPFMLIKTTN